MGREFYPRCGCLCCSRVCGQKVILFRTVVVVCEANGLTVWVRLLLSVGHQTLEAALIACVDDIALTEASFAFG